MPLLPHNFPTLRGTSNGDHRRSMLLLGAGMSWSLAPLPGALLGQKRIGAEAKLGLSSSVVANASPSAEDLYQWADDIFTQLVARGDPNPKLMLAQSLEIPREQKWLGCVAAQRNAPRHRIIARFAREGLWNQIWSLNWDCIQESAFENTGIKRNGYDGELPWPTAFICFVTASECATIGGDYIVKIIKPHGCVMALRDAELQLKAGNCARSLELSKRFLITKSELSELGKTAVDAEQNFVFSSLCVHLSTLPFVVAGWSASEAYLLDYFDGRISPLLKEKMPLAIDELSVIDIDFNANGHARLAGFYGKDKSTAHIPVDSSHFTTDELFLWLQALYAVQQLQSFALTNDKANLIQILSDIDRPSMPKPFVIEWADSFLPVWVRLCWRCGLVRCRKRNHQMVGSDDIALESRDEHIPLRLENIDRPELAAAGQLLAALSQSSSGTKWDFETFPGGLFHGSELIIPLPSWADATPNDLRGLKSLVDALKEPGAGFIDKLRVVFLSKVPGASAPDRMKAELKELVAREISLARFANGSMIEEIQLASI